ncbi:phage integrase SAM-like domain-containing protein [Taibaiella helva]|uniref:phage integrase SAM-like domain-containing protein n=1 Tax=Taibaiella helva TaxID=2301235 RepID=UPI0018E54CBE|nr:phage integrase SAM-like domain-containing protein [Taibaiella helva]
MVLSSRATKEREVPLHCRLTLNKQQKRFSVGITIPKHIWHQDKQKVSGKSPLSLSVNAKIQELTNKIQTIETQLIKDQEEYSIDDILNRLFNRNNTPFRTLMEVYDYKYKQMKELEGKAYKTSTIIKCVQMQNSVRNFLKKVKGINDIPVTKVDTKFLNEFELYLKSDRNMAVASYNKTIQKLKAMMKLAFDYGTIQRPAFPNHRFKHEKPKVIFLTMDELAVLEHYKFAQDRLTLVRDIFLFSVYTGLHYMDAMSLRNSNIIKGVDGKFWICYTRQKTDVEIHIPILERTQKLILLFKQKYSTTDEIVPRFSNQKINSYLKEIAEIVSINKPFIP